MLLDHEMAAKAAATDVSERMQSGDLDWRSAEFESQQALGKITAADVPELDPADAERLQGGLRRNLEEARLTVLGAANVAKRKEGKTETLASLDMLDKLAGLPDADIDMLGKRLTALGERWQEVGLDPAQFEQTRQGLRRQVVDPARVAPRNDGSRGSHCPAGAGQ
ncbi:hypothetical protein H1235_08000 [Pseudoxanthomonas sp. NC8]|nr:hypothetical protein H1235_08000 [Pseudoxanthomonas sp. NC8]